MALTFTGLRAPSTMAPPHAWGEGLDAETEPCTTHHMMWSSYKPRLVWYPGHSVGGGLVVVHRMTDQRLLYTILLPKRQWFVTGRAVTNVHRFVPKGYTPCGVGCGTPWSFHDSKGYIDAV